MRTRSQEKSPSSTQTYPSCTLTANTDPGEPGKCVRGRGLPQAGRGRLILCRIHYDGCGNSVSSCSLSFRRPEAQPAQPADNGFLDRGGARQPWPPIWRIYRLLLVSTFHPFLPVSFLGRRHIADSLVVEDGWMDRFIRASESGPSRASVVEEQMESI